MISRRDEVVDRTLELCGAEGVLGTPVLIVEYVDQVRGSFQPPALRVWSGGCLRRAFAARGLALRQVEAHEGRIVRDGGEDFCVKCRRLLLLRCCCWPIWFRVGNHRFMLTVYGCEEPVEGEIIVDGVVDIRVDCCLFDARSLRIIIEAAAEGRGDPIRHAAISVEIVREVDCVANTDRCLRP